MTSVMNSLIKDIEERRAQKVVYKLIFDSSKHKLNASTFHKHCDHEGPTLSVFYGVQNVVYGGYTSASWSMTKGFKKDPSAFLFTTKEHRLHIYSIRPNSEDRAIYCDRTFGPCFGGNAFYFFDFLSFRDEPVSEEGIIQLNGTTATFGFSSYLTSKTDGHRGFTGGNMNVHRVEVYAVLSDELDHDWLPKTKAPGVLRESLKQRSKSGLEGVPLNILLVGQIGSGKSSFINASLSAMSETLKRPAITSDGSCSETNKFSVYDLMPSTDTTSKKVCLFDVRGVDINRGMQYELEQILQGKLTLGYEFPSLEIPVDSRSLTERESMRIHMVCFVIDSATYDVMTDEIKQKLEEMKRFLSRLELQRVVILTKVDMSFHNIRVDPRQVGNNLSLKEQVETIAGDFGVATNAVFPVINYTTQSRTDCVRDQLVLHALTSIVEMIEMQQMSKTARPDNQDKWVERSRSGNATKFMQQDKAQISKLLGSSILTENPVRILMVGSAGSGKSSFINSISSTLVGRIFRRINHTYDSPPGESNTLEYKAYPLKMNTSPSEDKLPVRVCDMPGFIHSHSQAEEKGYSIQTSDIIYTIRGHIKSPFEFVEKVIPGQSSVELEPSTKKQVHGVCFVVSMTEIEDEQAMRRLNEVIQQMGRYNIPFIVILTKVDERCPEIEKVYHNPSIADAATKLCANLKGAKLANIFPVVNYNHEAETKLSMDILILDAFKSLLLHCVDFIESLLDGDDD